MAYGSGQGVMALLGRDHADPRKMIAMLRRGLHETVEPTSTDISAMSASEGAGSRRLVATAATACLSGSFGAEGAPRRFATMGTLKAVAGEMAKSVREYVGAKTSDLASAERVAELEARVAELERLSVKTTGTRYRGVFSADDTYSRGDLVTHAGGLWHCWEATTSKPGIDNTWQLTAKTR